MGQANNDQQSLVVPGLGANIEDGAPGHGTPISVGDPSASAAQPGATGPRLRRPKSNLHRERLPEHRDADADADADRNRHSYRHGREQGDRDSRGDRHANHNSDRELTATNYPTLSLGFGDLENSTAGAAPPASRQRDQDSMTMTMARTMAFPCIRACSSTDQRGNETDLRRRPSTTLRQTRSSRCGWRDRKARSPVVTSRESRRYWERHRKSLAKSSGSMRSRAMLAWWSQRWMPAPFGRSIYNSAATRKARMARRPGTPTRRP